MEYIYNHQTDLEIHKLWSFIVNLFCCNTDIYVVLFSLQNVNKMELAIVGMSRHKKTPHNVTPSDTTVIQIVVGGQVAVLGHTVEPDTIGEFEGVSAIQVSSVKN